MNWRKHQVYFLCTSKLFFELMCNFPIWLPDGVFSPPQAQPLQIREQHVLLCVLLAQLAGVSAHTREYLLTHCPESE